MNTGRVGDKYGIGAADEKAALDDADDASDAVVEMRRIRNAPEVAVEDVIAVIGNEGLAGGRNAQMRRCAEHFKRFARRFQAEGHNLDRNGGVGAKAVDELAAVDHDGKTKACGRD